MKHRIELDISFDNKQDAEDLLNAIEDKKTKAFKPKGNEKITCNLKARYHACTHDDTNPQSCTGYINVEFDKVKKNHKL